MATTRRRRAQAPVPVRVTARHRLARVAASPQARAVFVGVGTVGLAALGIALFGPKRFNNQIVQPVRQAMGEQAERLWDDSKPLREEIGKLVDRAQNEASRADLVRSFQSWIGHFRAG